MSENITFELDGYQSLTYNGKQKGEFCERKRVSPFFIGFSDWLGYEID